MAKRRSPGDGGLYKRSDGMWIGAVDIETLDGKRRRKTVSSKSRNVALAKLRELHAQIAAGSVPTTSSTTVGKWLDHWLETIAKPEIRPTTYKSYEQVLRLYVKPAIGTVRLDRLTAENIRTMHRATQERSQRFAQLSHAVVGKSLKQAMVEGLMARNPMEAVNPPRYVPAERSAFDAKTAAHILKTAISSRDEVEAAIWATAFLTGARRGELLGLEWDRVDLDGGSIDLEWQLQRLPKDWKPGAGAEARRIAGTLWWTRPKSKAGYRIVPLVAPLLTALKRIKKLDTGPNPHGLVWHFEDGRPWNPEEFHDRWKALLTDSKVKDAPLHAIRHTTATLLLSAGIDEQTRMAILGHNSAAVARGYAHLSQNITRAALGNLAALMPK